MLVEQLFLEWYQKTQAAGVVKHQKWSESHVATFERETRIEHKPGGS